MVRTFVLSVFAATAWMLFSTAAADEAKKDAAEAVGEGNAARWLDYYRRERGQQWESKTDSEHSAKTPSAPEQSQRTEAQDPKAAQTPSK